MPGSSRRRALDAEGVVRVGVPGSGEPSVPSVVDVRRPVLGAAMVQVGPAE
uniref:hypothetical protein n=1 Tax=Streptomyces spinoverrucosus TaxID=284043 RepID=UPI00142EB392|nr:hypothetical protein [Streptomyces spinoverrucosus]